MSGGGYPDSVVDEDKSARRRAESPPAVADRHRPPSLLLRVVTSRSAACSTRSSSTPRGAGGGGGGGGRPLDGGRGGGAAAERPDSALSNLSELDSGFDELRSLAVTPIVPPEIVVTGPTNPLPAAAADVTSSSVGNDPDDGVGEYDDCNANRSTTELSDVLLRGDALSDDDRYNASSTADLGEEAANNETGNTSAVSLSSPEAADGCRLGVDNSFCKMQCIFLHSFRLVTALVQKYSRCILRSISRNYC